MQTAEERKVIRKKYRENNVSDIKEYQKQYDKDNSKRKVHTLKDTMVLL